MAQRGRAEHCHHASRPLASRREILAALAALGAGAVLPGSVLAQSDAAKPQRVDVHHHFFPPEYLEPLAFWGKQQGVPGGLQAAQRNWTVARALEEMDRTGVATAVLSVSTPGIWFGDAAGARRMARLCNEFATEMGRDHKGRFGLFAALPLPDVEGSLREIEYALDTLKADGVGLMTSYGDTWPGDPQFRPVFDELNRRKAVVYFHPLAASCCGHLMPGIPPSVIEYPQDTARAVTSLLFNGGFARWHDIRFIFSHGGASVPVLAGRIANSAKARKDLAEFAPEGVDAELKRLHYDTANAAYAPTMAALLALVPASQVLFGSDYPYLTIGQNLDGFGALGLSPAQRRAIDRENAARLMPRWAA
jgi:predicted TIM-barrel fold metal-dependent hydrolase